MHPSYENETTMHVLYKTQLGSRLQASQQLQFQGVTNPPCVHGTSIKVGHHYKWHQH